MSSQRDFFSSETKVRFVNDEKGPNWKFSSTDTALTLVSLTFLREFAETINYFFSFFTLKLGHMV